MKKDTNKKPQKGLLDDVELAIESELILHELRLRGHWWSMKITVGNTLPETHRHYKMLLSFNEKPLRDQIESIERDLKNGLFADDAVSSANAKKSIKKIEKEIDEKRALCEDIDMAGTVLEIKYVDAGTQLVLQIPDTIIESLNRQKGRLKIYKIRLEPMSI